MKKIVKLLMKESTSISSFFRSMIVVLFGIIMTTTFVACGGNDDDDVSGTTSSSYSLYDLIGVWSGESSNQSFRLALVLYGNNSFQFTLFSYNSSSHTYESILQKAGTYQFNTNTGDLRLTYSDDNSTETFKVTSQTYSSITLMIEETTFYMTRYTNSDDGSFDDSGTTTDWAPSDASGKHFTLTEGQTVYSLYFDSNNNPNAASQYQWNNQLVQRRFRHFHCL